MRRVAIVVSTWIVLAALPLAAVRQTASEAMRDGTRARYAHRDHLNEVLEPPVGRRPFVAWMGDSTLVLPRRAQLPELVEERLAAAGPFEVRTVSGPGFDFYAHYFVLERVLALAPDLVVLTANPRLLVPNPDAPGWYDDLASALPPGELPRALGLPLAPARLTAARLLLMQCLRSPGCEAAALGLDGFRSWANDGWESAAIPLFGPEYLAPLPTMRAVLQKFYDVSLRADGPMMAMLGATVRRVRAAGVTTLVYVSPMPVALLREEGLDDADRRRRNVAVVREVTEAEGGLFVDLHDFLGPDEVDAMAHYTVRGARRLATVMAPVVARAARGGSGR